MKTLILFAALALITGCAPPPKERVITQDYNTHVVVIDGCQYIENGSVAGSAYAITHKGNCNNPIHIYAR